jgi:hypothetical protein
MSEQTRYVPWRYERPPFGVFGQIARVGDDRLVCHICGRDYEALPRHILTKHGMTAFDYKRTFGLRRGTALISPRLQRRLAEKSRPYLIPGTKAMMDAVRPAAIAVNQSDIRLESIIAAQRGHEGLRGVYKTAPCPKGHEWDGKTFNRHDGRAKQRKCQVCNRESVAAWRERKRAEAAV